MFWWLEVFFKPRFFKLVLLYIDFKITKCKQKFSMTTINDRPSSRQNIRQKISVIKTNSFDCESLTFDDHKGRNTRGENCMLCKGQSKESAIPIILR